MAYFSGDIRGFVIYDSCMKKILVIGSDLLLREMVASLLADFVVEVRTAGKIAAVRSECKGGAFDLVIMLDLSPFFDGSEPVALLRPVGLRRPELFVFSWQHSEHVVLSLLECGVSQYMTFPLNSRRIRRKICETLDCKI